MPRCIREIIFYCQQTTEVDDDVTSVGEETYVNATTEEESVSELTIISSARCFAPMGIYPSSSHLLVDGILLDTGTNINSIIREKLVDAAIVAIKPAVHSIREVGAALPQ